MRILACYADMHPATDAALSMHAPQAERVYVGDDDTAYWREISSRWTGEDDLVVIEQDNEITAGTLPSFAACSRPWCTFWYCGPDFGLSAVGATHLYRSLGCTKFSAELQRNVPHDTITDSSQLWDTIDGEVAETLEGAGYSPHVHGEIKHHHEYVIYWLPPDADTCRIGPGNRKYTWRHKNKGHYPTVYPGHVPLEPPPGAEQMVINTADKFGI